MSRPEGPRRRELDCRPFSATGTTRLRIVYARSKIWRFSALDGSKALFNSETGSHFGANAAHPVGKMLQARW
jgi:hypothetical protein